MGNFDEHLWGSSTSVVNVTTRLIARAAGVAEGTLYRHFPDETSLFFAAVTHRHHAELDAIAVLATRAGHGNLTDILMDTLTTLARLRHQLLPLELAVLADPALAGHRARWLADGPSDDNDIPRQLGRYLAAEKHLGRIDPRLDTDAAAITLLATLFGLAVLPHPTHSVDPHLLRTAVDLFVAVAQPQPPYGRGGTSEKSPR